MYLIIKGHYEVQRESSIIKGHYEVLYNYDKVYISHLNVYLFYPNGVHIPLSIQ